MQQYFSIIVRHHFSVIVRHYFSVIVHESIRTGKRRTEYKALHSILSRSREADDERKTGGYDKGAIVPTPIHDGKGELIPRNMRQYELVLQNLSP